MYTKKDLVCEGVPSLREKSAEVSLPLSQEDKNTLVEMLMYLVNSQDDKKAQELDLRPGVGLAAPQIGVNKKMFAIYADDLDGNRNLLLIINPKILGRSKEMVYLPGGEGCLSVNRDTEGVTPRSKAIKVDAYIYDISSDKTIHKIFNLKDYIAIVFQHEYDHLFGTLFVDKLMSVEEARIHGYKPLWDED